MIRKGKRMCVTHIEIKFKTRLSTLGFKRRPGHLDGDALVAPAAAVREGVRGRRSAPRPAGPLSRASVCSPYPLDLSCPPPPSENLCKREPLASLPPPSLEGVAFPLSQPPPRTLAISTEGTSTRVPDPQGDQPGGAGAVHDA